MTYVIAQPCVDLKDRACVDECPVDCIYEGGRMLYIHPDECVDCGACEPVCPVEAIFYEDDVPEQWKDYYKANVDFFDDLGSPGGASKLGPVTKDHPLIAALAAAGARTEALSRSGRLGAACPTFPGTASPPLRRHGARPWRTASSTCPSGRRLIDARPSCRTRWRRPRTLPAIRRRTGRQLREAAAELAAPPLRSNRCRPRDVLPTIGAKELVAWLPTLLGLGAR